MSSREVIQDFEYLAFQFQTLGLSTQICNLVTIWFPCQFQNPIFI
jgi:hypothetical protein